MTLKLDIEFVNKAAQRAKARAAEVAQHPQAVLARYGQKRGKGDVARTRSKEFVRFARRKR